MTLKPMHSPNCEVAVIGAGPYGLSIAAQLLQAGITTRVFGEPMAFWRRNMPKGMKLRSPWRATHLADAMGALSLDVYATMRGVDPSRLLALEDFVAYGEWFQAHAVPDIDRRIVRSVDATDHGFALGLSDGEIVAADRVVVAVGLANQDYRPPAWRDLPAELVTHSCEHADFAPFRGKRIAVIGRGQSACESAALLAEAGAEVDLISRGDIRWLGGATSARKPGPWHPREFLASPSAVGPFPLSWLAEWPAAVRHLPAAVRDEFTARCLKAGAAGWLKPRFANVRCHPDRTVTDARVVGRTIAIELDGRPTMFDHVVLGTGYRIDLRRIGMFSQRLLDTIACAQGSPLLGPGLQSSVPNLHFAGAHAVKSFGPLLRFIAGVRFAASAIADAAFARRPLRTVAGSPRLVAPLSSRAAADLSPPR
jgi:cation diffusion facilitator CzcD-associated flavoprotein CzcO